MTRIYKGNSTLRFHAPGRGNLRFTTWAELGMLRSSVRPWSTPTTRPGRRISQKNVSKAKAKFRAVIGKTVTRGRPRRTKGVSEFDLRGRSAERHGHLSEAGVKGHVPLVLLSTVVVGGQQVDLQGLHRLLHPFENLAEVEKENMVRSLAETGRWGDWGGRGGNTHVRQEGSDALSDKTRATNSANRKTHANRHTQIDTDYFSLDNSFTAEVFPVGILSRNKGN